MLKIWLRARMEEKRLRGLALLLTHRIIILKVDSVIERFAKEKRKKKKRYIDLIL